MEFARKTPVTLFADWLIVATGEALDAIVMEALGMDQPAGEDGGGPGLLTQLSRTVGSMQRFMKQLSN